METLLFSFTNIVPIFLIILSGVLLRQLRLLSEEFIRNANKLIFTVAMPILMFQKMRAVEKVPAELAGGIAIFIICTLAVIVFSWFVFRKSGTDIRANVVQGSFRCNLAIVGLAIVQNVMSSTALTYAMVVIAVIMPLNNILAIIILGVRTEQNTADAVVNVLKQTVKNPLIIGILTGLLFALFMIPVPEFLDTSLDYYSRLTLPLALISIGGSLRLSSLMEGKLYWGAASFLKLIILPLLIYAVSSFLGLSEEMRAVLVIEASSPVAVVSFVMAEGFGINPKLMGEIISVTTLLSIVTISFWVAVVI